MKKDRIGLIADFYKKEAMELAGEVREWLHKRDCAVSVESASNLDSSILKDIDFIVTLGGDGTVLRAANSVARYNIPIARVNFGTAGFLCNIEPDKVFLALEKILANQYQIETRDRINARIIKENKEIVCEFDAFNEIVIGSTPEKKTTWIEVKIIDPSARETKTLKTTGDGLIIATRSGSTGYCLGAGGPALLEDNFAAVASNGYFESGFLPPYARSFVTSVNARFEITVLRGGPNLPCIVADSDSARTRRLQEGERVIITRSELKNLFIEF